MRASRPATASFIISLRNRRNKRGPATTNASEEDSSDSSDEAKRARVMTPEIQRLVRSQEMRTDSGVTIRRMPFHTPTKVKSEFDIYTDLFRGYEYEVRCNDARVLVEGPHNLNNIEPVKRQNKCIIHLPEMRAKSASANDYMRCLAEAIGLAARLEIEAQTYIETHMRK